MSQPTTSIYFSSATPAAPSGKQNVVFQSDGGTPQQKVSAYDPPMVGDTGSGGTSGNVPAPAAGDAIEGKFLKADGTWSAPTFINSTHDEPLTDGNGNFIFAGGDIIVLTGVPN
jgi:hypothetical protein